MKKNLLYIMLSITLVLSFSCKDYMSVEPDGYIQADNTFKNADDAIAAWYGLHAMMQPLVDQIWLAGEAQGDLVLPARGADNWITEIAQNRVTPQNPYTDYTRFYKMIVACNNVMKGLGNILKTDPANYTLARYNFDIAEITCMRSWTYLQLAKIWGDVPYISTDITSVDQITAVAPEKRDTILNRILKDVNGIYEVMRLAGSSSNRSLFSPPSVLIMRSEIYLELGNLTNAWDDLHANLLYSVGSKELNIMGNLSGDSWLHKILGQSTSEYALKIDFNGDRGQKNNLQRWTKNSEGGIYALKPSPNAVDYWDNTMTCLLEYQTTMELGLIFEFKWLRGTAVGYMRTGDGNFLPGILGDSARGAGVSYNIDKKTHDTLIFKFIVKDRFIARSILNADVNANDDADFCVWRAGTLYILSCEMINNTGRPWLALELLNGQDTEYNIISTRSRLRIFPFSMATNEPDPVRQVNRYILEEAVCEGAFEGARWFNLVRMSRRPGYESWLGEYVSQKYPAGQREAIKTRLSNPAYWYWPYYYKNTITNTLLKQKSGY